MGTRPDSVGIVPDPTGPHLPHLPEPSPELTSAVSAAVASLAVLARFPAAAEAAQRALAALSQLGPDVGHSPSVDEGVTERESVRNVDMTSGPIASGVELSRDSLNGGSRLISSHEDSKPSGNNASNREQHNAWCGICQVGCNSFQILEQHKNGKRHKKNLQSIEQLKRVVHVSANMQDTGTSGVGDVVEGEAASKIPVNIDCNPEIRNCRVAVQPLHSSTELSDRKSSPCKKRKSNGNGTIAKRAKNAVTPVVCSVCNIKCDTREVFDKHLSGKKHISKVKRFQLRQPRNREIGLRAVYLNLPMSQAPPLQDNEYHILLPEGSYLPPMPQAYTPFPPQVHYQVDNAGNTSVSSFQHPGPQALEAAVSFQGNHNISPAVAGVQRW